MAEAKDTTKLGTSAPGVGTTGGTALPPASIGEANPTIPQPVRLKNVWPIPTLFLATAMLIGGMALAWTSRQQKPDPAAPFNDAVELVDKQQFEAGLDALNSKDVLRFIDFGDMSDSQRARYHLSLARALFGAQAARGLSVRENFRNVVQEFAEARKLGAVLEPSDSVHLAESLLAVGEVDKALDVARTLPDADGGAAKRTRLIKMIIEHNLAAGSAPGGGAKGHAASDGGGKREAQTLELLASLVNDPELSNADKAWVLARQSELLLTIGRPDEAIGKLIRRIGLLRDVPTELQGELYLLLGKAYFESDQPANAARQLEIADTLIDKTSPMRAEMNTMLGLIAQKSNPPDLEVAHERYATVVSDFPDSRAVQRAILGVAEVEAAMAALDSSKSDKESMERYAELVESVNKHGARGDVTREAVLQSLMQRHQERIQAGKKDASLRYAMLAETLYKEKETPPELLAAIGLTQRSIADDLMAHAKADKPDDFRVEDLDLTTRAEVKQRYMAAGEYLKRHALSVAATDPGAYAASLWTAAESFDNAGDLDEAAKAYSQYADGASDNDPQKPAAKFRLAQVFQAKREYAAAVSLYKQLVVSRGAPGTNTAAGFWADQAIVPLARCLFDDGDAANDSEAEQLLLSVLDGSKMTPEATGYRDALILIGTMSYNARKYPEAIGWLEQAAARYKTDRQIDNVRYRLADSHRLESMRIGRKLEDKLPQSQAEELARTRTEHLRAAQSLFQAVRESLESRDPHSLSSLEKVYIRNAYFYAGDCAFDLRDFDSAIAAYDAARLKFTDDPSSLVAMAQIVSAYAAQEKWAQARTANERARQQLQRFPDDVWQRPDLPMEKRHWEEWLRARRMLEQAAQANEEKEP